jgi:hypothetical protein
MPRTTRPKKKIEKTTIAASLTRVELDKAGCSEPNCTNDHSVLYMAQGCHPTAGVDAKYEKASGTLMFKCHECDKPMPSILVGVRS